MGLCDVHHPRHSPPPLLKCVRGGECRGWWTSGVVNVVGDERRGWWTSPFRRRVVNVGGDECRGWWTSHFRRGVVNVGVVNVAQSEGTMTMKQQCYVVINLNNNKYQNVTTIDRWQRRVTQEIISNFCPSVFQQGIWSFNIVRDEAGKEMFNRYWENIGQKWTR